jgi:hypothetical protein
MGSKTVDGRKVVRGFESLPLRSTRADSAQASQIRLRLTSRDSGFNALLVGEGERRGNERRGAETCADSS